MKIKLCLTLATALLLVPQFLKGEDSLPPANDAAAKLRIGFIDLAAPGATPSRNAAALAFAQTQGVVTRLQPVPKGGLRG